MPHGGHWQEPYRRETVETARCMKSVPGSRQTVAVFHAISDRRVLCRCVQFPKTF